MVRQYTLVLFAAALAFVPCARGDEPKDEAGFVSLFDGKTLEGWEGDPDWFAAATVEVEIG